MHHTISHMHHVNSGRIVEQALGLAVAAMNGDSWIDELAGARRTLGFDRVGKATGNRRSILDGNETT